LRSALLVCFCSVACTFAGTLTTTGAVNGTPFSIIDVTGFTTLGSDMGGLSVTATFAQSGTRNCSWAATSATGGGCTVAGFFSINEDGDTFSGNWTFTNLSTFDSISILALNGAPTGSSTSGTVFDRTFGGVEGTPGSALGSDLSGITSNASNGTAVYSNIVSVGSNAPVGDLYGLATVTFGTAAGALLTPGASASFVADTDTIGVRGTSGGVPEPGAFSLLACGLACLFAARSKLTGK